MLRFLRRARKLLWRRTGSKAEDHRGGCPEYYNEPEPDFEAMRKKYNRMIEKENKKKMRRIKVFNI